MLKHTPVLLQETVDMLPEGARFVMDGTLGHGGHTAAIVEKLRLWTPIASSLASLGGGDAFRIVGVDRDGEMIQKAKMFLDEQWLWDHIHYVQASYTDFTTILQQSSIEKFDFILIDIGVNMDHFKVAERGFSIKQDGPLDMRYDRTQWISAAQWLEKATYKDILEIFKIHTDFGAKFTQWITEELHIAKRKQKFSTTGDVKAWAKKLWINDKKLAVIFQALRIVVNGELDELAVFLQSFYKYLTPWWRCVVLTYHSGEDRMVKYTFKDLVEKGIGELVNKKVIKPHWQEVKKNKAARSAKLRGIEIKLKD